MARTQTVGNIGVGIDIEDIARFEKLDRRKNRRFLERIFTARELAYCFSKKNSAPYLAVRFSAKEAVIKALANVGERAHYHDIEIVHRRAGYPVATVARCASSIELSISLTHASNTAIASAFVLRV